MGLLSIVIPAYNEGKLIHKTAKVVSKLMHENQIDYEIVFVNDGSKDETWDVILEEGKKNPCVKGVGFSKNFGKEGAIFAGLEYASGDCIAVMDCDLQHPPEVLIDMYHLWEKGYEVIEGVKASRGKESLVYRGFAKVFYGLMSSSIGIDMRRASDFKLLDRKAAEAIVEMPERHVFFRALSSWIGFKTTRVEFDVREREEGSSKWSVTALWKYAISNISSFSTVPMQCVMGCGIITFVFSVLFGIYSLIKYFRGNSLEGFTTVILLQLIIGSVLMFSLGIIGYYIAKIYEEVKRRPRYIVRDTTNIEKNK